MSECSGNPPSEFPIACRIILVPADDSGPHIRSMKDLRNSQTCWSSIKADRAAFEAWLYDQYRGEVTAAGRIEALRDAFASPSTRAHRILTVIAAQERKHARWVGELLAARGLEVRVNDDQDRY